MPAIIPIIKTTFTIPTPQGKDVYSPLQKLISKNKMFGTVNKDSIELSTYNKKHAGDALNLLTELKSKFTITTKND